MKTIALRGMVLRTRRRRLRAAATLEIFRVLDGGFEALAVEFRRDRAAQRAASMFGWFQFGGERPQQREESDGLGALGAGRREIERDRSVKPRTIDERDHAVGREFTETLKCQSKVGFEEARRSRKRSRERRGIEL